MGLLIPLALFMFAGKKGGASPQGRSAANPGTVPMPGRDHRAAAQGAVAAAKASGATPGTPLWQQAAAAGANAVIPGSGAVVGPLVHALSDLF